MKATGCGVLNAFRMMEFLCPAANSGYAKSKRILLMSCQTCKVV